MTIKFLKGRQKNCTKLLDDNLIKIKTSLKNYNQQIDESTLKYQRKENEIIMKLTVITLLCSPISAVSSLFGMNVYVPWKATDDSTVLAFCLLLIGMLAVSAIFYILYRKFTRTI